ncbi:MAG: transcriptional regulator [Microgenomates group bacterium GW2011_GWC1_38_14]|nr:MAG: transcriptional regulator [Candidatus Levybacteria bacterium GW2011_GWA2_36_13]KKQ00387.1 MAG: transcriptional regulator [Candidatus Levybacteria bacterium GW2011_GWB1_36_18]KKQ58162.1 MAG: transcriptional regulator [Microgenomates group bacterium GW2011_GWC1_38_14]KKR15597.1 MAG: transcriptional regulator [Candidatus Levybacteria bacterium GW2011_GWA1_39_32]
MLYCKSQGRNVEYKLMSGHSKWSQIKRSKGAADIKKGQTFTKISNTIAIAVKEGGGVTDPNQNFKLRLAVEAARAANMPKENVERAIKRASGAGEGANLEVIEYEGFTPFGISVIVETVTDNPNRTLNAVKSVFTKAGGRLATPGAVSYQFKTVGEIKVNKNDKTLEDILDIATKADASDVEEVDGDYIVYTEPGDLSRVRERLIENGLRIEEAGLFKKANAKTSVDQEKTQSIVNFLEQLGQLEDVHKVYSNLDN